MTCFVSDKSYDITECYTDSGIVTQKTLDLFTHGKSKVQGLDVGDLLESVKYARVLSDKDQARHDLFEMGHNPDTMMIDSSLGHHVADLAIAAGVDVHRKLNHAEPLMSAVNFGYDDIVIRLIKLDAKSNDSSIMRCAAKCSMEVINLLAQQCQDCHMYKSCIYDLLYEACEHGRTDIVDYFVEKDFDLEIRSNVFLKSSIENAAKHGQLDIIEKYHTKVNINIEYLVAAACENGDNVAMYLIPKCLCLTHNMLDAAVQHGKLSIIEYLVKHGKYLDKPDEYEISALERAVEKSHIHIIEYLLDKDCEISKSVQQQALYTEDEDIIFRLFRDVQRISEDVFTYALGHSNIDILDYLISKDSFIIEYHAHPAVCRAMKSANLTPTVMEFLIHKGLIVTADLIEEAYACGRPDIQMTLDIYA